MASSSSSGPSDRLARHSAPSTATLPPDSAQVRTVPMWPMIPSAPVRTRRCRTAPPRLSEKSTVPAPTAANAPPASRATATAPPSPVMASTAPSAMTSTPIPPAIPCVGKCASAIATTAPITSNAKPSDVMALIVRRCQ